MPPLRPIRLLLFPALAVAGWFGGRWMHEGLLPSTRNPARRAAPQTTTAREPSVSPASPEGKWMSRARAATTAADFAGLMDEFDTLFPKDANFEARDAAQKWLLGLWISQDADAAAAYVAGRKNDILGASFGIALGSVRPEKAGLILNGEYGQSLGKYFATALQHSLAAADPRGFLKLFTTEENYTPSPDRALALGTLAATAPEEAASIWFAAEPKEGNPKKGDSVLVAILTAWVQRDSGAARLWTDNISDPELRRQVQHAWLGALAGHDLAAARRALAEAKPGDWIPSDQSGGLTDARLVIAAATAREDLPAALADLAAAAQSAAAGEMSGATAEPPSPDNPAELFRVVQNFKGLREMRRAIVDAAVSSLPDDPSQLFWALQNLKALSTGAKSLDAGQFAELETEFFMQKMRGRGSSAVLEMAGLLTAEDRRPGSSSYELVKGFIGQAANNDPAGTLEFITSLPEAQRGDLAVTAFLNISPNDSALVARAAALIPPNQWDGSMGNQLARNPDSAAPVVQSLPVTPTTGLTRTGFAGAWARNDPQAAARWVTSLPADDGATQAARGLVSSWANYDDAEASAWTATLPNGPARDGAALGLAAAVAGTEPEAAWKWAAAISDGQLSADAYWNIARQWGNNAPPEFRAAFSAALDAGGYVGDIKAKALRDLDKAPAPIPPSFPPP